jgi:predicted transcriptional regulator
MKPRENGDEDFVMVHQRDLDSTIALLGQRRLELRDAAVFLVLINYVNWRSGKAHVTTRYIAERLNVKLPVAVSAVTRLRKEGLVRRVVDRRTGEAYFLINPYLASVGGPKRRGHLWQQFEDSLE